MKRPLKFRLLVGPTIRGQQRVNKRFAEYLENIFQPNQTNGFLFLVEPGRLIHLVLREKYPSQQLAGEIKLATLKEVIISGEILHNLPR